MIRLSDNIPEGISDFKMRGFYLLGFFFKDLHVIL